MAFGRGRKSNGSATLQERVEQAEERATRAAENLDRTLGGSAGVSGRLTAARARFFEARRVFHGVKAIAPSDGAALTSAQLRAELSMAEARLERGAKGEVAVAFERDVARHRIELERRDHYTPYPDALEEFTAARRDLAGLLRADLGARAADDYIAFRDAVDEAFDALDRISERHVAAEAELGSEVYAGLEPDLRRALLAVQDVQAVREDDKRIAPSDRRERDGIRERAVAIKRREARRAAAHEEAYGLSEDQKKIRRARRQADVNRAAEEARVTQRTIREREQREEDARSRRARNVEILAAAEEEA